jgi:hypothetical protein
MYNVFIEPHQKIIAREKQKNPHNTDHKVAEGIYVAGTLWDGEASFLLQRAVAPQPPILLLNNGLQTHIHDSIR